MTDSQTQIPARAVEVGAPAPPTTARVRAVVPCFNRPGDLEKLLRDFERVDRRDGSIAFDAVVVDNNSSEPLAGSAEGVDVEILRLADNLGGSGGYNAGMARALRRDADRPDYIWLVDSDARVDPDTLTMLLEVLERDLSCVAVGPALCDPEDGQSYELGGRVEPWGGGFMPFARKAKELKDPKKPFECDYVAACCALVRADAIERTGLFPEVFLNGDDVEWFVRLAQRSDGRVLCRPDAKAYHPRFDRVPTAARYFLARNAYGPIHAMGYGPIVRWRRARVETMRALNQVMMDRIDLAMMHIRGLSDAANDRALGPPPPGRIAFEGFRPYDELAEALRPFIKGVRTVDAQFPPDMLDGAREIITSQLAELGLSPEHEREHDHRKRAREEGVAGFIKRALLGPPHDLALTPAKGRPVYWFSGRVMVQLSETGFVVRRVNRFRTLARAAGVWTRGNTLALRVALRGARPTRLPRVDEIAATHLPESASAEPSCALSVVILSYNRSDALVRTIESLLDDDATRDAEIIVVDNASSDGSVETVRTRFPGVHVLALDDNVGVAGFNRGVEAAGGQIVLILDDDARPEAGAVRTAMRALDEDSSLAAVTLLPKHPETKVSEWSFGERTEPRDDWSVMGCANLVRRRDWLAAGGYDERFFLYRNDTDLALKLGAMGRGVRFDPGLVVWHDTLAAARKSNRWHRVATRNWVWLCKRHGRGWTRASAIAMGWLWAHKAAGLRPRAHWATLSGFLGGVFGRRPALSPRVRPGGAGLKKLIGLRFGRYENHRDRENTERKSVEE